MLNQFFFNETIKNLEYEPTEDQKAALSAFTDFFFSTEHRVFILNGYAGTGKTTVIKSITKTLLNVKYPFVLLAPTGRAAKVLSNYCQQNAYTIHKHIYRQKSEDEFRFVLNYNSLKQGIFFIDEASLLSNEGNDNNIFGSGRLLDDLLEFVFQHPNNKLVIIGDAAQLPPVGSNFHPALNTKEFNERDFNNIFSEMKEVVRQQEDSTIYKNATLLRKNIEQQLPQLPIFNSNKNDFEFISSSDSLEYIGSSYSKVGLDETVVLCYSNKRALQINKAIRNRIFFYENELVNGELLMVVKNNYMSLPNDVPFNFIANGEMIHIRKLLKTEELYGFRFKRVYAELSSAPGIELPCLLLEETLFSEQASLSRDRQEELYRQVAMDFEDIKSKKKRMTMIRENPYFNALQIKYAYAITAHKSQGGQWKHVYIDLSFLNYTDLGLEQLKWIYTAITRATEKIFIIDLPQKFAPHIKNS